MSGGQILAGPVFHSIDYPSKIVMNEKIVEKLFIPRISTTL
jgi:hypothetical protein